MVMNGVSFAKFLQVGSSILQVLLALPENLQPERQGCYFSLLRRSEDRFLGIAQVGIFSDPDFAKQCFGYCQEKALRLLANPEHFSSWQSRDFDAERFGGAITTPSVSLMPAICRDLILSASGLPEHGDEAFDLTLGVCFNLLNIGDVDQIITVSKNPLAHPLITACEEFYQQ